MPYAITDARYVELLDVDLNHALISKSPVVVIPPQSKVEILDQNYTNFKSYRFVNVKANISGKEETGWVPKLQIYSAWLTENVSDQFTGVKYGSYKVTDKFDIQKPLHDNQQLVSHTRTRVSDGKFDSQQNRIVLWANKDSCEYCGQPRSFPKIHELNKTRQIAKSFWAAAANFVFYNYQQDPPATKATGQPEDFVLGGNFGDLSIMIGVLHVCDMSLAIKETYFALSGETWTWTYTAWEKLQELMMRMAREQGMVYVDRCPPVLLNVRQEKYLGSLPHIEAIGELACAAPKLVQAAIHNDKDKKLRARSDRHILSLSEISFRPSWMKTAPQPASLKQGFESGLTADSCDRCRSTIPFMLGGYENPFRKENRSSLKPAIS